MKTSHILLAIIAVITLTGMVAADVLLKQQYDKLDWNNPYHDFEHRSLPAASHLVIEGTPAAEIMLEYSSGASNALVRPEYGLLYRMRQQNDTVFVSFTPDFEGQNKPKTDAFHELTVGLILRVPELRSLRITNGRLTLKDFSGTGLALSLQNSRLRTEGLTVSGPVSLLLKQQSFAVLGGDRYKSLQLVVQDSSGVLLNDTRSEQLVPKISPGADVQLSGQALRWLKGL